MAGILSALGRGKPQQDPMRASAALTTVYLLEQNQKFEQFMRRKVEELEARVAAQQARLSTRQQAEERELWAELESFETPPAPQATPPVAATEVISGTNFEREDEPAWDGVSPGETAFGPDSEADWDGGSFIETPPPAEALADVPDYLALMLGPPTPPVAAPAEPDSERLADDTFDSVPPDLADSSWDTLAGEDISEDEPDDDLESTLDDELNDTVDSMVETESESTVEAGSGQEVTDQAVTAAPPEQGSELPVADFESDFWASRTYEAFQVRLPEAEAVEHLWAAVGVERLDAEPAADVDQTRPVVGKTGPGAPSVTIPARVDQTPEITENGTQAEADAEEAWEATLPGGRKGDWT